MRQQQSSSPAASSNFISRSCSRACAGIGSRAAADQQLQISTAASSAYVENISRDGEAWQQTQIRVQQQKGALSADAAKKEKLGSRCR